MFYEVLGDEPVTPQRRAAVQQILEANKAGENVIVTSVITHLEVIPAKLEAKKPGAAQQYLGMFDAKRFVEIEINRNILLRAGEIREFYFRAADPANGKSQKVMDTADAIHLATATIYSAGEFNTRDDDQKASKIPLVSLYSWSGVNKVCGKYPLNIVSPEAAQGVLDLETQKPSAPANPATPDVPSTAEVPAVPATQPAPATEPEAAAASTAISPPEVPAGQPGAIQALPRGGQDGGGGSDDQGRGEGVQGRGEAPEAPEMKTPLNPEGAA
jgi:predicted nucleic acid-binding protein